jgi:hypothetical protein
MVSLLFIPTIVSPHCYCCTTGCTPPALAAAACGQSDVLTVDDRGRDGLLAAARAELAAAGAERAAARGELVAAKRELAVLRGELAPAEVKLTAKADVSDDERRAAMAVDIALDVLRSTQALVDALTAEVIHLLASAPPAGGAQVSLRAVRAEAPASRPSLMV